MFKYILIALNFVFNVAYAQIEEPVMIRESVGKVGYHFKTGDLRNDVLAIDIRDDGDAGLAILNKNFFSFIEDEEDLWYGENPIIHSRKILELNNGNKVNIVVASLSNGSACEYNTRIFVVFDKNAINYGYKNGYVSVGHCYYGDVSIDMEDYVAVLGDTALVSFDMGKVMVHYNLSLEKFKE